MPPRVRRPLHLCAKQAGTARPRCIRSIRSTGRLRAMLFRAIAEKDAIRAQPDLSIETSADFEPRPGRIVVTRHPAATGSNGLSRLHRSTSPEEVCGTCSGDDGPQREGILRSKTSPRLADGSTSLRSYLVISNRMTPRCGESSNARSRARPQLHRRANRPPNWAPDSPSYSAADSLTRCKK